jgi:hypothetical protein
MSSVSFETEVKNTIGSLDFLTDRFQTDLENVRLVQNSTFEWMKYIFEHADVRDLPEDIKDVLRITMDELCSREEIDLSTIRMPELNFLQEGPYLLELMHGLQNLLDGFDFLPPHFVCDMVYCVYDRKAPEWQIMEYLFRSSHLRSLAPKYKVLVHEAVDHWMLSRFGINDGDILIPFNSEGDFLANMKIKTGDGGKFILSQT